MALRPRSPDGAGISASWFVMLLALTVHGVTAFAPPPKDLHVPKGCSNTKSIGLFQSNHQRALYQLFSNKSPSTAGGDEAVHAISRAFLAELEGSGRVMTKRDQKWWARFEELEEYKREYGDCNVPFKYKMNQRLGEWVSDQRQRYQQMKLSSERIEALESMGFEWARPRGGGRKPDDSAWWKHLGELEEYKREYGDCNVPRKFSASPQLGMWVSNQRTFYKKNNLNSERVEALESIGFEWTRPLGKPDDEQWWNRFGELKEYKQIHGDCNVPINYQANPQLGTWVMSQRACYHRFFDENWTQSPMITEERIEALNKIGFEWRLRDRAEWDERFDELVIYKEEHGDTLVPMDQRRGSDNKYRDLAMWVTVQRQQYRFLQEGKHSHLTDERIQKLIRIGFVWDAQEGVWGGRFAELVAFKAAHGHTDVPKSWENQQLFRWVSRQRSEYRKFKEGKHSQITEERTERLDGIGFELRSKKTYKWKIRLGELRDFYDENGVGPVPRAEHPTLYNWATKQKKEYDKFVREEKTNLDEDRIKDLESIGFFDVFEK